MTADQTFIHAVLQDGLEQMTVSRGQHDPGPPDKLARRVAVGDQGFTR
ncbi:hypothetical protein [Roseinatronobacter alkalisoli]|uniref:Transposase n=1 Tax=Roseinatronobacter alkalisoli TaxID=3028235 RepID=A0ABT5TE64_9RHOB|nr:hypothetical protein [Roseinatronobacter sp. HJB301]MDD7973407.1 hypothetical protein [Roseinatronobacter sp. HJB301]